MNLTYIYIKLLFIMLYTSTTTLLATHTLATQQIQQLQYIASLCPYTDGYAVYQARFLLFAIDSNAYENICEMDINGNGQRVMEKEQEDVNTLSTNTAIKVYPNPANDVFVVELTENTTAHISVYNSVGQIVIEKVIKTNTLTIDTANLPSGIYNVKARGDNIVFNTKLIIIK